jgi:hypothetical protein
MSAISLVAALKDFGKAPVPAAPVAVPGAFHSSPSTLRALIQAMRSPGIGDWFHVRTSVIENKTWTEECQGIGSDGHHWFFPSNNESRRAVWRVAFDLGSASAVDVPPGAGSHVGSLAVHQGTIFVAMDDPAPKVWMLDANLNTLDVVDLSPQPGIAEENGIMGWCAINPWNGWLYTSQGDNVTRLHAYDPANAFAYRGALALGGPAIHGVQGGVVSSNGHLYLTSDRYVSKHATKDIRAYSMLDGRYLGSKGLSYDTGALEAEEMEGLTLMPLHGTAGDITHVHVVILDNDVSLDDVFIRHFAVPDPSRL